MDNSNKNRNFSTIIKTIYFYIFSAVGLILIIIGLFNSAHYLVKKTLLPKYDLGQEEQRCDFVGRVAPVPLEPTKTGSATSESYLKELEAQKKDCQVSLEEQRKVREVTDLSSALSFLVIGAGIFIFHYRVIKKKEF